MIHRSVYIPQRDLVFDFDKEGNLHSIHQYKSDLSLINTAIGSFGEDDADLFHAATSVKEDGSLMLTLSYADDVFDIPMFEVKIGEEDKDISEEKKSKYDKYIETKRGMEAKEHKSDLIKLIIKTVVLIGGVIVMYFVFRGGI